MDQVRATNSAKIIKQRNLTITAEDIKSARTENMTEKISQAFTINKYYKGLGNLYHIIGIFSIINTLGLALTWKVNFLIGLGITQIIDNILIKLFGQIFIVTTLISFGVSSLYFIFGYLSKKKSHLIILIGLSIYGLDTFIMFLFKYWVGLGFHIFILLQLSYLYYMIVREKKNNI